MGSEPEKHEEYESTGIKFYPDSEVLPPDSSNSQFVGFLCNHEVYDYLKELKDSGSFTRGTHHDKLYQLPTNSHMPTLIYETLRYFKTHNSPCMVQNADIISTFVNKIKDFGLTKAEKLTILNLRPTQPVDIQAIVEESEERLTETQVTEILKLVEEHLPEPEEPTTSKAKVELDSE